MTAITQPFPVFVDADGTPIDNGYIYIGTAGANPEVSPIAVYWDSAQTQPAAQPLRTNGGYIARTGTQASVFVGAAYSISVRDSNGSLVFYSADSSQYDNSQIILARLADTASASNGAGMVGYNSALTYPANTVGAALQSAAASSVRIFDIAAYGGTNASSDNGPALRAACAAAEAAGGGIVRIGSGSWTFSSCDMTYETAKDEFCIANLSSNVHLQMDPSTVFIINGAVLSVTAPFNAGKRFNGIGTKRAASNIKITGGKFSTNGWVLDIAFRTVNAVLTMADYVTIEDIKCIDMPGRNMIVSGAVYANEAHPSFETRPKGLRLNRCVFINGAQNVSGNTNSDDCSFVYVHGDDIAITSCTFRNVTDAVINCGGIELHSSTSMVENCYFEHLYPAIYTGWQDTTTLGAFKTTSTGNTIVGNTFVNNKGGIFLVSPHESLEISGNSFYRCWISDFAVIGTTRLDTTGASSGTQVGVAISGNVFNEIAGIKSAIRVAGFQQCSIEGNTFIGMAEAVNLLLASDSLTSDVNISGNNFTNPPTSGYSYQTGFVTIAGYDGPSWAGTYQNVTIQNNQMSASADVSANLAVLVAAGNATYTTITSCRTRNNTVRNIYAGAYGARSTAIRVEGVWLNNPQPSIWYQTTGFPSIGNGTFQSVYIINGNTVTVNYSLIGGSTTLWGVNTSEYRFKLPIAASSTALSNGHFVNLRDSAPGTTYAASGGVPAGQDYVSLSINAGGVRSDYPFVWASGDAIETTFTYVISP